MEMAGAETDTHQYLRAWRKYRKMTLEKVSKAIGSKVNTISGWETGNRGVNLDDLSRLAAAYWVSAADLLQSPEAYDQRQASDRLGEIADRLTPEQDALLRVIIDRIANFEALTEARLDQLTAHIDARFDWFARRC